MNAPTNIATNIGLARVALASATLLTAATVLAGESPETAGRHRPTEYRVVELTSLGGTVSSGNSINDQHLVAGFSNLDDSTAHATLWLYGFRFDLGTLGGRNSNVPWPVKNTRGLIAGISQTATPEPLGETWSCRNFFPFVTRSGYTCLGVVWENGEIHQLPTFPGGNNGFATGANNKRHVVGWAENSVHDSTCVSPQKLQFRAALWKLDTGEMKELLPFGTDPTSAATAINDRDQVVGISGICNTAVGSYSAAHAVMWDRGTVIHLGNLGGIAWNTPMAINQSGDVVGFSNISAADANRFNAHAFLWTKRKGIEDLGTLPGDTLSQALGINDKRQIVGISCTTGFASCRAFLWENGVMTDVNELVESEDTPHLYTANDINEHGHITGYAVDDSTQESIAIWAIPVRKDDRRASARGKSASSRLAAVKLPTETRLALLQQLGLDESDLAR